MQEQEIWKDIPEYDGYYQASNLGNIRSVDRVVCRNGSSHPLKGNLLKISDDGGGYLRVQLSINGNRKSFRVHRIIAKTFIKNEHNKREVNHINGIKHDNRVCNLEWNTSSENQKHAYANGLKIPSHLGLKGGNHHCSKGVVALDDKMGVVDRYDSMTLAQIATGVFHTSISNCCRGKYKTAGGYKWMYTEEYQKKYTK